VIEKQVEIEIALADFNMHLTTDESKSSTQFQQEFFHMPDQPVLDGALVGAIAQSQEIEKIGVLRDSLGKIGLRRRQGCSEIAHRIALPSV
jgi:hypothetical protein